MAKYLLRRILYIILVLFIVSFVIFMLFRTMPGDPVDMFLPPEMAAGMEAAEFAIQRQEIIDTMRLDEPHVVQYFYWLAAVFQGNFGQSMETRLPVIDHIRQPMTNTIVFNIINMILVFSITIPVGIYCAIKRGKTFDNVALVGSMFGISTPTFLVGLILIVTFVVLLPGNFFPMFGMASVMPPDSGTLAWYLDRLRHMALPLTATLLVSLAALMRFTRSAMIDTLNMDFVRTARSKGLPEKTVIYIHAFRNALIPIITVMAGWFIMIFSGTMAIELTFQWQGMGVIMLNALNLRDIGVLMTMNVFYALIAFTVILLLDIAYVIADPRIRLQ